MNLKLTKRGGYFGIMDDEKEVVPFMFRSPNAPILEWVYWQRKNLNEKEKFLDETLTEEEIIAHKKALQSQIKQFLTNS